MVYEVGRLSLHMETFDQDIMVHIYNYTSFVILVYPLPYVIYEIVFLSELGWLHSDLSQIV